MSRYCLDTSAYSRFCRGEPAVARLLDAATWIGVPAIVLGELWVGFLGGHRLEANTTELRAFLRNPAVETLTLGDQTARIYAEIVVELRAAGTPLPTNDIWIAATAALHGASVVSYDRHFAAITRIGSLVLG